MSRIGSLATGVLLAVGCGILAWISFALLTMMMDPALDGEAYRSTVQQRMLANPSVSALMIVSGAGVLIGFLLMGRAAWLPKCSRS